MIYFCLFPDFPESNECFLNVQHAAATLYGNRIYESHQRDVFPVAVELNYQSVGSSYGGLSCFMYVNEWSLSVVNGLGSMLKAVSCVLAIVKGKLKPANEITNENFLRIYQRIINYISSLVLVEPKMNVKFPSPLPPTLENVNASLKFTNHLYGKKR